MKRLLIVGSIIGLCASSIVAHGQFGNLLSGLKGSGPSPEQVVKNYVAGAKNVLRAQEKLLIAVGKKEQAAKAALQADNLTEGATKQNLEDATTVQTESSKVLEESLRAEGTVIDADAKVVYAEGLGFLGRGVTKYAGLASDLRNFKPSATSVGGATQGAMYVAESLPGNMSNLSSSLSSAIEFGRSQGVEIPADATLALK